MKNLRIAFIATTKNPALYLNDPAFIYRCQNLAMALQSLGHRVTLIHYSELSFWQHFDIAVFHRPRKNWLVHWHIKTLKRKGCKVLADFDDLVFLPEYANVSPGVINQVVSFQQTQQNFADHWIGLHYCDACVVSVVPLQQKMAKSVDCPVLVMPNAVHQRWYAIPESQTRLHQPKLTYFPGTRSHDQDFATIKPVLEEVLHEEPELHLQITGVLTTDLRCRPEQLSTFAKQPFDDYAQHVAQSWLNLAPLAATEFNAHKSGLKAIEASWFNAPTLATPIPDMVRLANAGAILVHTADEWFDAIKAHLSTEVYTRAHQGLRQKIMAVTTVEQQAKRFLQFVESL